MYKCYVFTFTLLGRGKLNVLKNAEKTHLRLVSLFVKHVCGIFTIRISKKMILFNKHSTSGNILATPHATSSFSTRQGLFLFCPVPRFRVQITEAMQANSLVHDVAIRSRTV